ncbi:S-adenosylmethionine (SAM)-dependent methyltransferase [Shouchella clausii KSM-K16]|uniref:S-adenosylmethionine (SAM)-dependent methyltransferase n=1 Tax=Shouchella clausii (strain KSM-K16) TaxID=66692 RepID=Q5WAX5_SHOC1|nr:class I SAM-dependent rRNA methyltransferase [Shouchella clausii]BAD66485.1 S-adenosylmethionine (SAM)-dependent methyltransferase [Shouchella clausii KSM-K16]
MKAYEQTVTVSDKVAVRLKKGHPLFHKDDFHLPADVREGTILRVTDSGGRFLVRGYYGKQNVGQGWVLSTNKDESIDVRFFKGKIETALNKRAGLFVNEETTAFRVLNGEGDGVGGLTIDYYEGFFLVTWYSKGMYSFRSQVLEALTACTAYKGIYEKKRFASEGQYVEDDDFVCGERGQFPLLVKENGMYFAVYLNDGPMTGIFLDQRHVRKQIRDQYAPGARMLNLFSYTGAFSVAAALGGAANTTSVDLANRSRSKTEEQFLINGIAVEDQHIVVMDAFRYLSYAEKNRLEFDLVVLDPPSFARSKKRTFSAAKDYTLLLEKALSVTAPNGIIVASTNAANVERRRFKQFVDQACTAKNCSYELLEEHRLPEDFATSPAYPQGQYLKVLIIRITGKE